MSVLSGDVSFRCSLRSARRAAAGLRYAALGSGMVRGPRGEKKFDEAGFHSDGTVRSSQADKEAFN